jgi:predicted anti-sigma-YlaC factor YlaD
MRCSDATVQLQLYIDRRLTMSQVRVLEAHVAQCAACRNQLYLLEEVASTLHNLQLVAEPADMTMRIMQRVAVSSQRQVDGQFSLWRPSLVELLTAVFLASITTLVIIWQQPSLRAVLPFANPLTRAFATILHLLVTADMGTLSLVLWIGGTILGICITLALVGDEIRSEWFKAMMDRLPVR